MDLRQKRCERAVDTRVISIWEALFALWLVSSTSLRKVWYAIDLEKIKLAMGGLLSKNMIHGSLFLILLYISLVTLFFGVRHTGIVE